MRIISICLWVFVAQNVFAALPPTYRDGMMTFSVNSEYFTSNANYDRYSDRKALPNGNKFEDLQTTVDGKFDLPANFALGGGIGLSWARSKGPDQFTGASRTRTNSEFTDAHFYGQYYLDYERFRLVPEVRGKVVFKQIYINDLTNDSVLTNDYASSAQAGSWFMINFGQMRGYGYLGYMYQDDNRASELPWEAGLLWRNRNWLVSGSFDGYQPVTHDKYNKYWERENRTFFVDGDSFRYYNTDATLTEFRLTGGFAFENNMILTAGWGSTVMGTETAQGQMIFAGLSFGVDMAGGAAHSFSKKKHKRSSGDGAPARHKKGRVEGDDGGGATEFQPDLEEYDESLFD